MTLDVQAIRDEAGFQAAGHAGYATPGLSVVLCVTDGDGPQRVRAAIKAVLVQEYEDFELVVVTAGPDGRVRDEIDAARAGDERVAHLDSPAAVGNPALMAVLGLGVAVGRCLTIARCTRLYHPDALLVLNRAIRHRRLDIAVGRMETGDGTRVPGERVWHPDVALCLQHAFLETVLFDRRLLDEAGCPDPHLAFRDIWEWDFLRRLFAAGLSGAVGQTVARTSEGPPDAGAWSALATATLPMGRAARLVPRAIGTIDPLGVPDTASLEDGWSVSGILRDHQERLRARPPGTAPGAVPPPAVPTAGAEWRKGLILVVGTFESSTSLLFDGLPDDLKDRMVFVERVWLDSDRIMPLLLAASVVFVVRNVTPTPIIDRVVSVAVQIGVPLYYVLDDNFVVLSSEQQRLAWYTMENLRERLRPFAGMIVTSENLLKYFQDDPPHPNLSLWTPIYDGRIKEICGRRAAEARSSGRIAPGRLRVGFIGGPFRQRNLLDVILPALERFSKTVTTTLLVRDGVAMPATSLEVAVIPAHQSFPHFLFEWSSAGCDILIHPQGLTSNIGYKTQNVLLCADYLGAVPVVACEPAFETLNEMAGAIVVNEPASVDAWTAAFGRLAVTAFRDVMKQRLRAHCREVFDPEGTARSIRGILATAPDPSPMERERRWQKFARCWPEPPILQDR